MNHDERLFFQLHAKLKSYSCLKNQAIDFIAKGLGVARSPVVSLSWGKDSTVMLHLVQQVRPDILTIHVADENADMLDSYQAVKINYFSRFPTNYEEYIVQTNGQSVPSFFNQFDKSDLNFIGFRAGEKGNRKYSMKRYGELHQYKTGSRQGTWRCLPLMNWGWRDVWAYIVEHDLPYLESYDHYAMGSKEFSRTSSVYSARVVSNPNRNHGGVNAGRIAKLKATSPTYFNYLKRIAPELVSNQ